MNKTIANVKLDIKLFSGRNFPIEIIDFREKYLGSGLEYWDTLTRTQHVVIFEVNRVVAVGRMTVGTKQSGGVIHENIPNTVLPYGQKVCEFMHSTTHPDFQKQGLWKILVEQRLVLAKIMSCKFAITSVLHNYQVQSLTTLGFQLAGAKEDVQLPSSKTTYAFPMIKRL